MDDKKTTIDELKQKLSQFRNERGWAGEDLKDYPLGLVLEAAEVMERIDGIADLHVEQQVLIPRIDVKVLPEAARRFGLTPGQIRQATTTLIQGMTVGEIYDEQKIFDVAVWGVPEVRGSLHALRSLRIDTPSGALTSATRLAAGSRPTFFA